MQTNNFIESGTQPQGYGIFPYLLICIRGGLYLQVPVYLRNSTFCNKAIAKEIMIPKAVIVGLNSDATKIKRAAINIDLRGEEAV